MSNYDAVIIGAGLGGLAAATKLARAGLSVKLFERHVQPGGYATTFMREGFEFEVSLHELSGIGRPGARGPLWRALTDLGVAERVDFLEVAPLYRSLAPGIDLRVPPGFEAALSAFSEAFPHERRGLANVFKFFKGVQEDAIAATGSGSMPGAAETLRKYPRLIHAATVPLSALLDAELDDPGAKLGIAQIWGYFGLPPERLSLLYFAVGAASYFRYGASYPKGKSQALSNAFEASFREAGGELALGRGVHRIEVAWGRVTGVVTEDDERVAAPIVLSNASPHHTLTELIPAHAVPAAVLKRNLSLQPSLGSFCVHLGLSRSAEELGMRDHEVFVQSSHSITAHYESYRRVAPPEAFLIGCYNVTDKEFSRSGTTVTALVSLACGQAWAKLPPADYPAAKNRLADAMLERVERIYPGLRDAIRVAVVTTPLTNIRYTGNPHGSVYGYANTPAQNPAWRPGYRGPLKGLWFAGAWTRPGGGFEPCIESGWLAARQIIADRATGKKGGAPRRRPTAEMPERSPALGDYMSVVRDGKHVVRTIATAVMGPGKGARVDYRPGGTAATLARFHPERTVVRVSEVAMETPTARVITLRPRQGIFFPFTAGQYVNLFLEIDGVRTSRPYSICSTPARRDTLELAVRSKEDGFVSNYLVERLRVGDRLEISGPRGEFSYSPLRDTDSLVFLAGGSGIAPVAGIITDALEQGRDLDLCLLYGSRNEEEIIFGARLEALAAAHPRFGLVHVLSEPGRAWRGARGLIDRECILTHLGSAELSRRTFFICGPPQMCALTLAALRELGVSPTRIRLEAYGVGDDLASLPGWPEGLSLDESFQITLAPGGQTVAGRAGEPLMVALERARFVLPALCRSGKCALCRTRLIEGRVFQPDGTALRESDRQGGYIHPCVSYPLSDVTLALPSSKG